MDLKLIVDNSRDLEQLDVEIKKLKELLTLQAQLNEKVANLIFLTVEDISEMTGWSKTTVLKLFNEPDFPCCDFGKEKKAEIHAVLKYFSVPHRKAV